MMRSQACHTRRALTCSCTWSRNLAEQVGHARCQQFVVMLMYLSHGQSVLMHLFHRQSVLKYSSHGQLTGSLLTYSSHG